MFLHTNFLHFFYFYFSLAYFICALEIYSVSLRRKFKAEAEEGELDRMLDICITHFPLFQ